MSSSINTIGFSQRQRLTFIESVAYWEGAVDRPRVSSAFNVSENHVTKDFRLYKDAFPGNIQYDESSRVYRPSPKFKPRIGKGSVEEYLSLLRTFAESEDAAVVTTAMGSMVAADALPWPKGKLEASVLNTITRAIASQTGLEVNYQSLSSDHPSTRRVWPHALVFSGTRWHARTYDEARAAFIDLVLQRFISAKALAMPAPVGVGSDAEWNHFVTINVIPDVTLSPSQAAVVAQEFGMSFSSHQWIWKVRLRECLAGYFIKFYRLDLKSDPNRLIELQDKSLIDRYCKGDVRGNVAKSAKGKG